jgi:phosphopantothenoylcysteine decarboxylase/phosphopantothenate--cysteine ligase
MTSGICDNLLLATYFSATCPVVVAPAMDEDMWLHPVTKSNIEKLEQIGNRVIPVEKGELASGLYGDGRMAEPEHIISFLEKNFFFKQELAGLKALVTAGPTHEPFDPVRYIGNQSTGKMGMAIAGELADRGAEVNLVLGPVSLEFNDARIKVTNVQSADEMYEACMALFPSSCITVMSAAVADYKPVYFSEEKIKKNSKSFTLELSRTKDILLSLGEKKKAGQILVGFALENRDEVDNAKKKLESKNADMIVLNSLNDVGAGFGFDTNQVTIFEKNGTTIPFGKKSKQLVARDIVDRILKLL